MLLNASHAITNCGLPQQIQERYVRYKRGNRAIVAWMTRYGPEEYKGKKTLPIKQLIVLGKSLCDKVQEVGTLPSDVDYYFTEVIKERAYLSKHFRYHRDQCDREIADTINHEHFTNRYVQIHNILSTAGTPTPRKTTIPNKPHARNSSSSLNSAPRVQNIFQHLPSSERHDNDSADSDNGSISGYDTAATSDCSHDSPESQVCNCETGEDNADFLDTEGQVGLALETIMFTEKIERAAAAIQACWLKAGRGEVAVAAAAAYTNVILNRAVHSAWDFHQNEPDLPTPAELKAKLSNVACNNSRHPSGHENSQNEILNALSGVQMSLQAKAKLRKIHQGSPQQTKDLVSSLVASYGTVLETEVMSSLTFDGIPCIREINRMMGGNIEKTNVLVASVVVYLLSISHCSYSSSLPQPSRIALPRISALKLANEALRSIKGFIDDKSIFPCQCANTLGFRIAQMQNELEAFAKHKCWDVLMQSPLVAGNHVLEIIDLCSYYGMHLFHYRQYNAAVLHTYQALVQLKTLDVVPVLEEVCDMFAPVLYTTGVRPESGFMASWLRYIGARLKFKKGKKAQTHKDTWCMSVPAHVAARSAGLNIHDKGDEAKIQPKFDYGTIDLMIRLKHQAWNLQPDQIESLDQELRVKALSSTNYRASASAHFSISATAQKSRRTRHTRSKSCHTSNCGTQDTDDECIKLDHSLATSFTSASTRARTLPPARFNLLSFFHCMTKVVSGISDTTHAEEDGSGRNRMCLCFVQTTLRAADRILDVRKRSGLDAKGALWSKNEKECIESFKSHLVNMLEEARVLEGKGGIWLWSDI